MDGGLQSFNFILRTYGCASVGVLLSLVNIPVMWILLATDRLRKKYRITAFLLLANALTGLLAALSGFVRFRYYFEEWKYYNITSIECLYQSVSFWLIWINLQNGTNLLITSIDRMVVVAYPGYYFKNGNRLTKWLIVSSFSTAAALMLAAVLSEVVLSKRQISALCKEQDLFRIATFNTLEIIRCFVATLGIAIMVGVVVIMRKRKAVMHVTFTSRTTLLLFINNQKQYTTTVLLSSTVTFFLFVLPTAYQLFLQLRDFEMITDLKLYAVFLSYLNAFNVATVTIFRQKDVKFCRPCHIADIAIAPAHGSCQVGFKYDDAGTRMK